MKELQIVKDVKNEISYDNKGEGYISQRGIAKLIGVHHKTVQNHIAKVATIKTNKNNQIHEGSFLSLLRSIGVNNEQVTDIVRQIETMGVKSVFHGVATPQVIDPFELMQNMLQQLMDNRDESLRLDEVKADKVDLERLENSLRGTNCPKGYMPAYKLAGFLDVPFNSSFKELLKDVRFVQYPFTNGNGNGLQPKLATGYHVEDTRMLVEG